LGEQARSLTEPIEPIELVDIVDEHDQVVGTVTRRQMRRDRLRHRAVFIVVRSTIDEVLIHRRSDAKDLWPGWWDLAAGGVVVAGETYEQAAGRELAEELGVEDVPPVWCGRGAYEDDHVRELAMIYSVVHDGPFRFADGEVVEAQYVSVAELDERVAADRFLPDSVALVRPLL